MEKFTIIIVEDVPLELRGTEGILRTEVPEAEVIGTADSELAFGKYSPSSNPTSYCSTLDSAAQQPSVLRSAVS